MRRIGICRRRIHIIESYRQIIIKSHFNGKGHRLIMHRIFSAVIHKQPVRPPRVIIQTIPGDFQALFAADGVRLIQTSGKRFAFKLPTVCIAPAERYVGEAVVIFEIDKKRIFFVFSIYGRFLNNRISFGNSRVHRDRLVVDFALLFGRFIVVHRFRCIVNGLN